MSFKNTFIRHDRSPEVTAWIEEEKVEQEERFATIVKQMEELDPKREKWYQEFFDRLKTIGFNQDGDLKVKIAPRDIAALLAKPDPHHKAFLFYGHDEGLIRERARKTASHFTDNPDDPFAVTHLTGQDVAADKASLSDNLNAVPAFGGIRLVMLSGAGTEMTEPVKQVLDNLHDDARLIIQARDVNTRHALVKLCDQHGSCASVGCYQDDSRSLSDLPAKYLHVIISA